jgi:hypothetical protein
LTGDKIRISNEVNSANINIVDIRSTMLAITEYDVIRDGSHPEHAVFKLNGIYYKGGTPGAFITSVGTNFRDLLNGDTYVKLGYGGVTPALWLAETVYSLNDVVRPNISLPPGTGPNGKFYVCTSAGTSGSSQPTWGTTNGGTTADDGATWTCYPEWSACDSWVGSTSVDPPSVNAGAEATFTITTGAFFPAACFAEVNPVALTAGLFVRRAYVSDVGVITVVLRNETGSPIDDAAGFWRWKVSRFI